jgi:spermidine/putrescine-binding protein
MFIMKELSRQYYRLYGGRFSILLVSLFLFIGVLLPCAADGGYQVLGYRFPMNGKQLYAKTATLPFGTRLKITNQRTQRFTIVTVGGRLPMSQQNSIQLSPAAADAIGMSENEGVMLWVEPLHTVQMSVQNWARQSGTVQNLGHSGGGGRLVLYTWADMFPESVLDAFTQSTGIQIIYKKFNLDEDMLSTLEATGGSGCDLVIADDYIIDFIIKEGLAQKLNRSAIPNWRNINSTFQYQFYDPNNDYTVPYGAGVQTIIYNSTMVNQPIYGYADLWNPDLVKQVGVPGSYRVVDGMALKKMGESYNTNDVNTILQAGDQLQSLAPNIFMIRDSGLDDAMLNGQLAAAVMYTGEANHLRSLDPTTYQIVYPAEGIGFGIQAAFIPSRAANPDAATQFLNFILDGQRGAECFEYMKYYCTYTASEPYLSPASRNLLILPDLGGFEMIRNISHDADNAHKKIWRNFQNAVRSN